jgi:high-affinity K+ transport system ATPase subunit B
LAIHSRHRKGADGCRKLFLKAVNSVTDDPRRVCDEFLQFEREEGTLESFEAALARTEAQMKRLKERQEKVRLIGVCGDGCVHNNFTWSSASSFLGCNKY